MITFIPDLELEWLVGLPFEIVFEPDEETA